MAQRHEGRRLRRGVRYRTCCWNSNLRDELASAQDRMVRGELERDEVLRRRLAALPESDNEIRAAYPGGARRPADPRKHLLEGAGQPRRVRRIRHSPGRCLPPPWWFWFFFSLSRGQGATKPD